MPLFKFTAIVLAGLWALGLGTSTLGGSVHVLAVLAAALLLVEVVNDRPAKP